MRKVIGLLAALIFLCGAGIAWAQAPKQGVVITDDEVQAVIKHAAEVKRRIPDNALRIIDMGKYQLGVAVVARGALRPAAAAPAASAVAAANSAAKPCGEKRPGATGPNGILHYDTAESYVVISGGGTLITGGMLVNGRRSAPDDEVTKVLNGPSCSGTMVGFTSRDLKTGDIVIIPEGVAHGFSAIPDHITYLSIRPDLKKVLEHGYVNPVLKK